MLAAMSGFGISGGGQKAEDAFRELTGASRTRYAREGDAVLNGHNIEVKNATSNTLNQVRAVKYITLVAYHQPTATWYVVGPHEIVRLVSSKARGQHTENPFESATLNIKNLSEYRVASDGDLRQAVLDAIASGDSHPRLREAMAGVLEDSKDLARRSIQEVRELLDSKRP